MVEFDFLKSRLNMRQPSSHSSMSPETIVTVFQSQLEFSLTPGPDQGIYVSQGDAKPAKTPHSTQNGKSATGTKVLGVLCV